MEAYTELRKIGAGSFGCAVLCKNKASGLKVVIKLVSLQGMPEDERRSAQREAHTLRKLQHPFILHYIDAFETPSQLGIVTEYCERVDLSELMLARRGELLPEASVLD